MPLPMVQKPLSSRVLKSRIARLWKEQERLDAELRKHPSKKIEKALWVVNQALYSLGEI